MKVYLSKIFNRRELNCMVDVFSSLEEAKKFQSEWCDEIGESWFSRYSVSIEEKIVDSLVIGEEVTR